MLYGSYMFGNSLYSTAYETRYVNSQLKWATVTNYEGAIEAGFLNNRLGFELAVYKKENQRYVVVFTGTGCFWVWTLLHKMPVVCKNTGFDLSLFHNNRINKDFSYAVNLNIAYVKNKITDKGAILTQMSKFWFEFTKDVVPNPYDFSRRKGMPEFFGQDEVQRKQHALQEA